MASSCQPRRLVRYEEDESPTALPFSVGYRRPEQRGAQEQAKGTIQEDTDGSTSSVGRELLSYPGHDDEEAAARVCRYICSRCQ